MILEIEMKFENGNFKYSIFLFSGMLISFGFQNVMPISIIYSLILVIRIEIPLLLINSRLPLE